MNLMYAYSEPGGNPQLGAACPRPLSRKKLRSLMRDNRKMLTASALASGYNRSPGPGRTRSRFRQTLDQLERDHKANPNVGVVMLGLLRGLFSKPKQATPARKRTSTGRKV